MTYDDLKSKTKNLLGQSLIKAWHINRNSHFSEKNWGNIEVKSVTLLEKKVD
ncbi:hypothetical protein STRDD11_01254 [Streptococcus sp. DD11]|nr:hypothetical protein STRDD11_01254 [Streptococcus sp. DD11]